MSGSMLSSAALDERRRRILFRAWRRGMREMDLVMGQFADVNLPTMSEAELDEFERLMEAPDPQLLVVDHRRGADAAGMRHAAVRPPARRPARGAEARTKAVNRVRDRPLVCRPPPRQGGAVTLVARPRATTPSSSPSSRARSPRRREARRRRSSSSPATACARRPSSTRSPSPRPRSRRCICPRGTANPMIASRPTPRWPPSA